MSEGTFADLRCSRKVYTGERADFGGHGCQRKVTSVVDGKPFCAIHSPAGEAKRKATWDANYAASRAKDAAKWAKEAEDARKAKGYDALHAEAERLREVNALIEMALAEIADAETLQLGGVAGLRHQLDLIVARARAALSKARPA